MWSSPNILVLIGALLVAIGTFWSSHEAAKKDEQRDAQMAAIAENVQRLVSEGKLSKEDARRILGINESVQLDEKVDLKLIPPDKK